MRLYILAVLMGALVALLLTKFVLPPPQSLYVGSLTQEKPTTITSYAYLVPQDWRIHFSSESIGPEVEWRGLMFAKNTTLLPFIKGTDHLLVAVSPDISRNIWRLSHQGPTPVPLCKEDMTGSMYLGIDYALAVTQTNIEKFDLQVWVIKVATTPTSSPFVPAPKAKSPLIQKPPAQKAKQRKK